MRHRQPIPSPSAPKHGAMAPTVSLPPLLVAKVELYNTMLAQQANKAELGRRLHWHLPQVDRVLDVRHASRLDELEEALGAVGKRLELRVVEETAGSRTAPRPSLFSSVTLAGISPIGGGWLLRLDSNQQPSG